MDSAYSEDAAESRGKGHGSVVVPFLVGVNDLGLQSAAFLAKGDERGSFLRALRMRR